MVPSLFTLTVNVEEDEKIIWDCGNGTLPIYPHCLFRRGTEDPLTVCSEEDEKIIWDCGNGTLPIYPHCQSRRGCKDPHYQLRRGMEYALPLIWAPLQ